MDMGGICLCRRLSLIQSPFVSIFVDGLEDTRNVNDGEDILSYELPTLAFGGGS